MKLETFSSSFFVNQISKNYEKRVGLVKFLLECYCIKTN